MRSRRPGWHRGDRPPRTWPDSSTDERLGRGTGLQARPDMLDLGLLLLEVIGGDDRPRAGRRDPGAATGQADQGAPEATGAQHGHPDPPSNSHCGPPHLVLETGEAPGAGAGRRVGRREAPAPRRRGTDPQPRPAGNDFRRSCPVNMNQSPVDVAGRHGRADRRGRAGRARPPPAAGRSGMPATAFNPAGRGTIGPVDTSPAPC